MKEFVYPEMLVHVPLCTHKEPKKVVLISSSPEPVVSQINKYSHSECTVLNSFEALDTLENDSVDVLIIDSNDLSFSINEVERVLNQHAIVAMPYNQLDDTDACSAFFTSLSFYFDILMPYRLEDGSTLLLASKLYHPTADIILDRSDLIDGANYYNSEIHLASFAMPNYLRKTYLGVFKN